METPQVPTETAVPTPIPVVVEEKKKFYRNPKVVVGLAAGVIATGVAFVIAGLQGNDSDSETITPVEDDTVVETFKETETTLD